VPQAHFVVTTSRAPMEASALGSQDDGVVTVSAQARSKADDSDGVVTGVAVAGGKVDGIVDDSKRADADMADLEGKKADLAAVGGREESVEVVEEVVMLGTWVATQRLEKKRGKLSAKRIQQLDALGFHWDGWLPPPEVSDDADIGSSSSSSSGNANENDFSSEGTDSEGIRKKSLSEVRESAGAIRRKGVATAPAPRPLPRR